MRRIILGLGLGFAAFAATAAGVGNKWRLQFSGNAESDGRIVLQLAPVRGQPIRATADIAQGLRENDVAKSVRSALKAAAGGRYGVEVDDGEDVLVKKRHGERDFTVTVVENSVRGVRINFDRE